MMTAKSIPASRSAGYARYLDGQTQAPEQGDYYLGRDGRPAEAPGVWLSDPDALRRAGVQRPGVVEPADLRALMAGHRPGQPTEYLRAAGPDGTRAGGLDVTLSAPKSVSVMYAGGTERVRHAIASAQHIAARGTIVYMRDHVPLASRWDPELGRSVDDLAAELHAAGYLHTTSRSVGEDAPDPQIHMHMVITSIERRNGRTGAVRSRLAFSTAREVGAVYRTLLAEELRKQGYEIEPAGEDGRYFRLAGVSRETELAFSKRARQVQQAEQEFRAKHGRRPEREELRQLAIRSRQGKTPQTRADLDAAWRRTAADLDRATTAGVEPAALPATWAEAVERNVIADGAVFTPERLRVVALEQAAGYGLTVTQALEQAQELREQGRIFDLADGRMTTATLRAAEQRIADAMRDMAADRSRRIDDRARAHGIAMVEHQLGGRLSVEQREAVLTITQPGRAAAVIGPAGTGKSVGIGAAAYAELAAGRNVYGTAVAGRTAQRLGEDVPALEGRVHTIDGFVNAVEHGRLRVDANTTVYVDEAGMGDTDRLHRLVDVVADRGGAIVAIGDPRQLPAIGPGGMFDRLTRELPTAHLTEVRRTTDPDTLKAWEALRNGDAREALDRFAKAGRLHFLDTRDEALESAVRQYDALTREHDYQEIALVTDASNYENTHLNRRVQLLRHDRGELSQEHVQHPDGYPLHGGDRVIWSSPMHVPNARRVENGQRGEVVAIDPATGNLTIQLDGRGQRRVQVDAEQREALRLGYATHIVREQGATVKHAVVVTGGWQTSQEAAYVEATRARDTTTFHVAREDLDGTTDRERHDHLAERMSTSRAQDPSITTDLAPTTLMTPLEDFSRPPGAPISALDIVRLAGSTIDHDHDRAADHGLELER